MSYTNGLDKPTDYFETKTWSGASGDLNITGLDFQPDWVWIKSRNTTGADHKLVDVVRGSSKSLKSNETEAESTDAEGIQSFNSDGYTLGDNDGNYNRVGRTYVGWNWLASNTTASNTDGSITSTVSANTTSGFSIVSYTGTVSAGATIGHGLGVAPSMIITKNRSLTGGAGNWVVYHKSLGNTKYVLLNLTNAEGSSSGAWNNTTPTSSVFTVGDFDSTNGDEPMIAYCFAEKKGFSKFGSYTGNGNADGTFIYTGFKPAFFLLKNTASSLFWFIHDSVRDPHNEVLKRLPPNANEAEGSGSIPIDFLSNGIKLRTTATTWNESGSKFIYMCFAENPFVTSTGIPTTAR